MMHGNTKIKFLTLLYSFFWVNSLVSEFYVLYIKFRRRGITQKKAYNFQNTVKVWNQGYLTLALNGSG